MFKTALTSIIFIFLAVVLSCYFYSTLTFKNQADLGNMNGVELKIPKKYQHYPVKYSGQDIWASDYKPSTSNSYKSGVDSISIILKWPSMESMHQNDNFSSYKNRYSSESTKWISFSVQSRFENLSPEKIQERINYRKTVLRSGITGILLHNLDNTHRTLSVGASFVNQGLDSLTGLQFAVIEGVNISKPQLWNSIYYWDGNTDEKISTLIKCPNGTFKQGIYPKCTHYFELDEFNADIRVYYDKRLVSEWSAIQRQVGNFINSMKSTEE